MRLTHVVEQLRQRAAMDVRMGKEDSARTLLSEKQKVMKALEAARQRAELLEQFAGKLNVVSKLHSHLHMLPFMRIFSAASQTTTRAFHQIHQRAQSLPKSQNFTTLKWF